MHCLLWTSLLLVTWVSFRMGIMVSHRLTLSIFLNEARDLYRLQRILRCLYTKRTGFTSKLHNNIARQFSPASDGRKMKTSFPWQRLLWPTIPTFQLTLAFNLNAKQCIILQNSFAARSSERNIWQMRSWRFQPQYSATGSAVVFTCTHQEVRVNYFEHQHLAIYTFTSFLTCLGKCSYAPGLYTTFTMR